MSILSKIKKGVANSGSNRGKMVYLKADSKIRLRFLQEIEDGMEVTIHDHFDRGIKALCQKHIGKTCPYCNDEDMRTRQAYIYSAFDYENKEVKLFEGYANNFNALPSLVAMYESYGTLQDRDYVIQREGSGTNTRYSVIPMDKVKFKNKNAKPYTSKKVLDILSKAYAPNDEDILDDDEELEDDDDLEIEDDDMEEEDDMDWDDDEDDDTPDYEAMKPQELYRECISRGLKVKKKQKKAYYIEKLEEDDEEGDDDDW